MKQHSTFLDSQRLCNKIMKKDKSKISQMGDEVELTFRFPIAKGKQK